MVEYRRLPHVTDGGYQQFVTIRLADALPREVIVAMRERLRGESSKKQQLLIHKQIEKWIDRGHGTCWLQQPALARIVEEALLFYDGKEYFMHSWVIMPNHVHMLFTLKAEANLDAVVRRLKSFTAKKCNEVLQRTGSFWLVNYFDRYIRNEQHFNDVIDYIDWNPVKAGLCEKPEEWQFGTARLWHRWEQEASTCFELPQLGDLWKLEFGAPAPTRDLEEDRNGDERQRSRHTTNMGQEAHAPVEAKVHGGQTWI